MNSPRLAILMALLFSATALAQDAPPPPPIEASVQRLLSGFEYVPTAKDFSKLGTPAEVITTLQKIADHKDALLSSRAIAGLSYYATPEVKAFLVARATNSKLNAGLRGKCLLALGYAFKSGALDDIAPLLKAKHADLREDAVLALLPMDDLKAAELLNAHAKTEKSTLILTTIKRVTKRINLNYKRTQLLKTKSLQGGKSIPPDPRAP